MIRHTAVRNGLVPFLVVGAGAMVGALQEPPPPIDVLFVGNSYTHFNNLPRLVEAISEGLPGPVIRAVMHTHGGFTVQGHVDDGHVAQLLGASAPSGDAWEIVVVQEQSSLGTAMADPGTGRLGEPARFHAGTRALVEIIRGSGAEPLLYMTWAKKRFPDQAADLARAYEDIGTELAVPVAPVGRAWARVRRERPDLELFHEDGSHPSAAGSYLAACVLYAALTGSSPEGGPMEIIGIPRGGDSAMTLVSLDSDTARLLQRVAWATSGR